MQQTVAVGAVQTVAYLYKYFQDLIHWDAPVLEQDVFQRASLDVVHGVKGHGVVVNAQVSDFNEIDVFQFCDGFGFQLKSLPADVCHLIGWYHLKSALFAQGFMSDEIDFTHAAPAKEFNDCVYATNSGARLQSNRSVIFPLL